MTTIHKQVLNQPINTIRLPTDSKILHAAFQCEKVCIWYECNPNNPLVDRTFCVFMTGEIIPPYPRQHISTLLTRTGDYVFHVYELTPSTTN